MQGRMEGRRGRIDQAQGHSRPVFEESRINERWDAHGSEARLYGARKVCVIYAVYISPLLLLFSISSIARVLETQKSFNQNKFTTRWLNRRELLKRVRGCASDLSKEVNRLVVCILTLYRGRIFSNTCIVAQNTILASETERNHLGRRGRRSSDCRRFVDIALRLRCEMSETGIQL